MAVTLDSLMAIRIDGTAFAYTDRESMLYALGIGMGRNPTDALELPFVYEGKGALRTVPTMATVLTQFPALRTSGLDYRKVLHAEQSLVMHQPLPPAGRIIADYGVVGVVDKGVEKGLLVFTETRVRTENGDPLYTAGGTIMARGDGGIGGSGWSYEKPHSLPDRAPDHVVAVDTRSDQALLYRLSGDRNPLHADPSVAAAAGFTPPILHGLCTYGIACHAVLASACDYDHARIGEFNVRFSSPVFPGETVVTEIWRDGPVVSFRCLVPERGVTAINNGFCKLVGSS